MRGLIPFDPVAFVVEFNVRRPPDSTSLLSIPGESVAASIRHTSLQHLLVNKEPIFSSLSGHCPREGRRIVWSVSLDCHRQSTISQPQLSSQHVTITDLYRRQTSAPRSPPLKSGRIFLPHH